MASEPIDLSDEGLRGLLEALRGGLIAEAIPAMAFNVVQAVRDQAIAQERNSIMEKCCDSCRAILAKGKKDE